MHTPRCLPAHWQVVDCAAPSATAAPRGACREEAGRPSGAEGAGSEEGDDEEERPSEAEGPGL